LSSVSNYKTTLKIFSLRPNHKLWFVFSLKP